MNIVIPIKLVPDLVEELAIDASGKALDYDWLRMRLNELDEHAIEAGLLLKEQHGGQVTIIALDDESIDEALFTAAAKGADRLIKLSDGARRNLDNHALAQVMAPHIKEMNPDVVLTGVQAHNDLDGPVGPVLAEHLGVPYIGYISGIQVSDGGLTVRKEFPGGLVAEMSVKLPAVLGIQAAEQPPRYVAFSKIRQAMQNAAIETCPATATQAASSISIERIYQPTTGAAAEMLEGSAESVADKMIQLFAELGVI